MPRVDVPTVHEVWNSLPEHVRGHEEFQRIFNDLCVAYAMEVGTMLSYAKSAKGEASVTMGIFTGDPRGQLICEVAVNDSGKPFDANAINWHGQNTSRWLYAGAIVYQDGRISTHH